VQQQTQAIQQLYQHHRSNLSDMRRLELRLENATTASLHAGYSHRSKNLDDAFTNAVATPKVSLDETSAVYEATKLRMATLLATTRQFRLDVESQARLRHSPSQASAVRLAENNLKHYSQVFSKVLQWNEKVAPKPNVRLDIDFDRDKELGPQQYHDLIQKFCYVR
jgi:hypothetical protein